MPVRYSPRLRRSTSARRRKASAASPRLPADSRTRAATVHAGIERPFALDRPVGGADGLREPAIRLQVAGQRGPSFGGPALAAFQLLPHGLDLPGHPASRLVVLQPRLQDHLALLVPLGQFVSEVQLDLGLVELPQPMRDLGQLDAQVEVVRLERDRLLERSDRLLQIAEAGQDLAQPAQGLGVPIRALGELPQAATASVGRLRLCRYSPRYS